MSEWTEDQLRCDAFLGGALHLWQPVQGYRAGVDPVLLAASVGAQSGQSVLDLGCGAGAVALSLGARVAGLSLVGLERHSAYAALAARNGRVANQTFEVFEGDVTDPPAALKAMSFDHVVTNPPYYDRTRGSAAPDGDREAALGADVSLADWVRCGAKRLKPKGRFHMILKADRLADALAALDGRLGSVEIVPFAPRIGRAAELILVRARKDGRAALRLLAPIILHDGDAHPGDHDHYTARISKVLRHGAALEI